MESDILAYLLALIKEQERIQKAEMIAISKQKKEPPKGDSGVIDLRKLITPKL